MKNQLKLYAFILTASSIFAASLLMVPFYAVGWIALGDLFMAAGIWTSILFIAVALRLVS